MAKKKKTNPKSVEAFTYDEASRKNIPTAEYQSVMDKAQQTPAGHCCSECPQDT